ncbi:MAG: hypothetical protein C0518_04010 [Opitutus sp.]|nr:hypothetical protein [Opitutus sp.]
MVNLLSRPGIPLRPRPPVSAGTTKFFDVPSVVTRKKQLIPELTGTVGGKCCGDIFAVSG